MLLPHCYKYKETIYLANIWNTVNAIVLTAALYILYLHSLTLLPAFWCLRTAVSKRSTHSLQWRRASVQEFQGSFPAQQNQTVLVCAPNIRSTTYLMLTCFILSWQLNEKETSSKLCSLSIVPTEPTHWKLHTSVKHRGCPLLWDAVPQIWATALQQISASAKTNTRWSQWDQVSTHRTGYTSCAGSLWQFMFPLNY